MGMVIAGAIIGVLLFFGLAIVKKSIQPPDERDPKGEPHDVQRFEAELEYSDNEGHHTRRLVTVRTVYTSKNGFVTHIKAYCHTRHQERTFRVDRIESMKTKGEAVQPRTYLAKMMSAANS